MKYCQPLSILIILDPQKKKKKKVRVVPIEVTNPQTKQKNK